MAQFEPAVELVLREEGGLIDNPRDPGGVTNFGIAQRSYQGDVTKLTCDQAIEIYRRSYWHFDGLNDQRLANLIFSLVVNLGWTGGMELLRKTIGVVPSWSLDHTLAIANRTPNVLDLLAEAAVAHYMANAKPEFQRGLVNRVVRCLV